MYRIIAKLYDDFRYLKTIEMEDENSDILIRKLEYIIEIEKKRMEENNE